MATYNPASLRVREKTSGLDLRGVVTLIFPDATVVELGQGAVLLKLTGTTGSGAMTPFIPVQDGVNPRLFTISGTDTWVASSIRIWLNGQYLPPIGSPASFTVSGTGNRTITLDPTIMPPDLTGTHPDVVAGEGIKL